MIFLREYGCRGKGRALTLLLSTRVKNLDMDCCIIAQPGGRSLKKKDPMLDAKAYSFCQMCNDDTLSFSGRTVTILIVEKAF